MSALIIDMILALARGDTVLVTSGLLPWSGGAFACRSSHYLYDRFFRYDNRIGLLGRN